MHREIKIFTELERLKNGEESKGGDSRIQYDIGLPHLLSYALCSDETVGEILMSNGGRNLEYWQKKIEDKPARMLFALSMMN